MSSSTLYCRGCGKDTEDYSHKCGHVETMIELMLPPLPGTDKAHPAFWIDDSIPSWKPVPIETGEWYCIRPVDAIETISAAAIAHYWQQHQDHLHAQTKESDDAITQWGMWSAIASGSREYDNCKIVAYEPRKDGLQKEESSAV